MFAAGHFDLTIFSYIRAYLKFLIMYFNGLSIQFDNHINTYHEIKTKFLNVTRAVPDPFTIQLYCIQLSWHLTTKPKLMHVFP